RACLHRVPVRRIEEVITAASARLRGCEEIASQECRNHSRAQAHQRSVPSDSHLVPQGLTRKRREARKTTRTGLTELPATLAGQWISDSRHLPGELQEADVLFLRAISPLPLKPALQGSSDQQKNPAFLLTWPDCSLTVGLNMDPTPQPRAEGI